MSKKLKILLISKPTVSEDIFVKGLNDSNPNIEVVYGLYGDFEIDINQSTVITFKGKELFDFDLVYFKTSAVYADMATSIANYLNKRNIKFIDQAVVNAQITSKIYQYVIFNDNGINIPRSIYVTPTTLKSSFNVLKDKLGLPFILKDIHGKQGRFNFIIHDKSDFNQTVLKAKISNVSLIAQKYINNYGDYRLLVFGDQIYLAIHRQGKDNHLNNLSSGGNFKKIEIDSLPISVRQQAIKAAKLLNRQVAGVDMIKDKDSDQWYCLEVNENPQISSGVLLEAKQKVFASFLENYSV
jgi:RimK family alpha-L-glutamate ligase